MTAPIAPGDPGSKEEVGVSGRLSGRVDKQTASDLLRGATRGETGNDSQPNHTLAPTSPSRTPAPNQQPPQRPGGPTANGRLERLAASLTPVDRTVLNTLAIVRMASGRQLNLLFWPTTPSGARTARRHLHRLTDLRLLTRLHRQVGGINGGSQGFTYSLDINGQRLVQAEQTKAIRRPTPSDTFVDHTLAVTEIYVQLHLATKAGIVQNVAYQPEPDCWRAFTGIAGRTTTLRPDAFARWATGDWDLTAFFEVDRATEHPARVARKADLYVRYWRTGTEQSAHQVFPLVVWVAPNARRAAVIRQAVANTNTDGTELFEVITSDDLAAFITNQPREEQHP